MRKILVILALTSVCAASETPTYDKLMIQALVSGTDIDLLKACSAAQAGISEAICKGKTTGQVQRQCQDVEDLGCCWDSSETDDMCMRDGE